MVKYNKLYYNFNKRKLNSKDFLKLKKFTNTLNNKYNILNNYDILDVNNKKNTSRDELTKKMIYLCRLGDEFQSKKDYQRALDNYISSSKIYNPKAYIRLIILYSKIEYYNEAKICHCIFKKLLRIIQLNKLDYYKYLCEEENIMKNSLKNIYMKNIFDNAMLLFNLRI